MSDPTTSAGPKPGQVPKFPPRPEGSGPTSAVIVSSLPTELPATLRTTPVAPPPREPRRPDRRVIIAAGVLTLALVAGLAWWLTGIGSEPERAAPPPTPQPTAYTFHRSPGTAEPVLDSDCATHAYGETKQFLAETRCVRLTRALFTTSTADGRGVHTSVSVVRMRTAEDARRLGELVERDGTGNVNDVVREGIVPVPGLTRLSRGGFASAIRDREVIIVESDTALPDPDPAVHHAQMKAVSADALRLGEYLD